MDTDPMFMLIPSRTKAAAMEFIAEPWSVYKPFIWKRYGTFENDCFCEKVATAKKVEECNREQIQRIIFKYIVSHT